MEINKKMNEDVCEVDLIGRLDTTTAPELETTLKEVLDTDVKNLEIDLDQLDYISSAGLRVLLFAQKSVNTVGGSMLIKNVKPEIMEVFEITGFSDILTIEK